MALNRYKLPSLKDKIEADEMSRAELKLKELEKSRRTEKRSELSTKKAKKNGKKEKK